MTIWRSGAFQKSKFGHAFKSHLIVRRSDFASFELGPAHFQIAFNNVERQFWPLRTGTGTLPNRIYCGESKGVGGCGVSLLDRNLAKIHPDGPHGPNPRGCRRGACHGIFTSTDPARPSHTQAHTHTHPCRTSRRNLRIKRRSIISTRRNLCPDASQSGSTPTPLADRPQTRCLPRRIYSHAISRFSAAKLNRFRTRRPPRGIHNNTSSRSQETEPRPTPNTAPVAQDSLPRYQPSPSG
jgi:hypothetical protein